MFSNSVRSALIRQIKLKKQAGQVKHIKNVPAPVGEINDSTAWRQHVLLGLSEFLVVVGQWLKSPNQLSF
jgi:hypothetical protein